MRVLTFLHSFELGGVERIALRLVAAWRALGVEAPLYVARRDGAMAEGEGTGGVPRTGHRTPWFAARFETFWMIATLPAVIRRERPDILFCAGNTYLVVAAAMKLRFGKDCPPIVAKISNDLDRSDKSWLKRSGYRLWLRIAGRYIDHAVGMADPARDEIAERLDIPADRITVIPDPALSWAAIGDARARSRNRTIRDGGRRFVSVGRLAPQKNIALMFRAFQRGAGSGDTLTVIGDGPQRAGLETLALRLGIADRVVFLGYIAAPIERLHEFDVLLLSSDYEGVPAVILEALAADLAIVATDCSRSMSALLLEDALGTLVPVGDETAFAAAIARARPGSSSTTLSLAQAERFTMEHAADAYLAVLARTARRSSGLPLPPCPSAAPGADRADPARRQGLES